MMTREEKAYLCMSAVLGGRLPDEKILSSFQKLTHDLLGMDEEESMEICRESVTYIKEQITPHLKSQTATLDNKTPYS